MKELGKWQIISFISRGMAMVLGFVQTFVILRILSISEWGTVQLATSIGGALGIYQHLGLASASTREISSAKDDEDIFKIFITSAFIRYAITLPIAFGLFFGSGYLSNVLYKNPGISFPLKIYAATLIFQGVQSIFNSVISGTKRFKQLFLYQVGIAMVSVLLYVPLVFMFRSEGYFYAFFLFNLVNSLSLGVMAFAPLRDKLVFPSFSDFKRLFKEIFSISMSIYLVKIIYTNWEKFGNNVLGLFSGPEVIAIYSYALLYAKKLMNISDSVTDVNLPVLSEKYVSDFEEFKDLFKRNFDKIFTLIILSATFSSYWAPEVSYILVGDYRYQASFVFIPLAIMAYVFYSFVNIVKSSVLIPAKMTKDMILSFVLLIGGTAGMFFASSYLFDPLMSMTLGFTFGAFLCFVYMIISSKRKLNFIFFNIDHWAILFQGFAISMLCTLDNLILKVILFPILLFLMIWSFNIAKFVTIKEILGYINLSLSKLKMILNSLKLFKKADNN